MHVSERTMTFYCPTPRAIAVRRAGGQVFKTHEGLWSATFYVELAAEYVGVDGSHFYREAALRGTRADAVRALKTWASDHLGAGDGTIPEGVTFRIGRSVAELPLTSDLDPARPYGARKERAA